MTTLSQKVLLQRSRRIAELLTSAEHYRRTAAAAQEAGFDADTVAHLEARATTQRARAEELRAKGETL